jgi:hypothetical protein
MQSSLSPLMGTSMWCWSKALGLDFIAVMQKAARMLAGLQLSDLPVEMQGEIKLWSHAKLSGECGDLARITKQWAGELVGYET